MVNSMSAASAALKLINTPNCENFTRSYQPTELERIAISALEYFGEERRSGSLSQQRRPPSFPDCSEMK